MTALDVVWDEPTAQQYADEVAAKRHARARAALIMACIVAYSVRAATASAVGSMRRTEMWTMRIVRMQARHALLVERIVERGAL